MDSRRRQSLFELGYELLDELGRGGMGKVWRARDLKLDREVAIKFIADAAVDARALERFHVEARALARIQHPNVVVVYQLGDLDGVPFLVYELVDGVSVDELVGELGWRQALSLIMDLARGLAAVHGAGVLHRDLKPANAVVTRKGAAKLIDFGLAKLGGSDHDLADEDSGDADSWTALHLRRAAALLDDDTDAPTIYEDMSAREASATATHALLGTPRYLAPELWHGRNASAATDVYALGLVAWELLSKRRAHGEFEGEALARAIIEEPLPALASIDPKLPKSLAALIDRAVTKSPAERFTQAEDFVEALARVFDQLRGVGLLAAVAEPSELGEDDRGLVQRDLARALAKGGLFERFYARLFALDPALRPLFPEDLREQTAKLADALKLSVASLGERERLADSLEALGARHFDYGVVETDLDTAGQALLDSLAADRSPAMDASLRQAWTRAWDALERPFRRGLRRAWDAARAEPGVELDLGRVDPSELSGGLASLPPQTRWIRAGELSLAIQQFGSGPVDLVFIHAWVSHCEVAWKLPEYADFMARLGRIARVTVFDKRGTGMSDHMHAPAPVEERMLDVEAVLDALELDAAVLLGVQDGGVLASAFAATHPERVRGLIWYASGLSLLASEQNPAGMPPPMFDQICAAILEHWGAPLFADFAAPSRIDDPAFMQWWSDYLRNGASPSAARWMFELNATLDVAPVLPAIGAPALVLHRRGDRMMPLPGGRLVAGLIPGARWVELDGDDHLPWLGDTRALLDPVAAFLGELDAMPRAERRLASLLAIAGELVECAGPVAAIRRALATPRSQPAIVHVGSTDRDPAATLERLRGLVGGLDIAEDSVVATHGAAFLASGSGLEFTRIAAADEAGLFVVKPGRA